MLMKLTHLNSALKLTEIPEIQEAEKKKEAVSRPEPVKTSNNKIPAEQIQVETHAPEALKEPPATKKILKKKTITIPSIKDLKKNTDQPIKADVLTEDGGSVTERKNPVNRMI
jgi:hypothetical protein